MTRTGAPTPPPTPPSEGEYARKLALAILSTLQTKGLLSASDVDAILIAARRSAQGQAAPALPARPTSGSVQIPMQVTVQTAPPPAAPTSADPQPAEAKPGKPEAKTPPVIDMKLD